MHMEIAIHGFVNNGYLTVWMSCVFVMNYLSGPSPLSGWPLNLLEFSRGWHIVMEKTRTWMWHESANKNVHATFYFK